MKPIIFCTICLLLAACNTMEGIGKDIKRGGELITDSAEDTKEKM